MQLADLPKMPNRVPVITVQCDWNEVVRLPNGRAWISSKMLNELSIHDELTTSLPQSDGKIKISFSGNYEYVSHGILSLVVKHISSGLKVAFVAPTKAHKVHAKGVLSVDAAQSSNTALTVSSDEEGRLLTWDSRTSEVLMDLKGHGGPVYKCGFFPSGEVILSAGADGSCRIWSATEGINPVTLIGHKMAITDYKMIEKGRNVVTVSKDGSAKLWDVGESSVLADIVAECGQINCCAITTTSDQIDIDNDREIGTGNKLLIVGCESGSVVCAHIGKRQQVFTKLLNVPVNACVTVNQSVIVGCSDGKIIQLSLEDGQELRQWHESANPVLSIAALPNQMFIIGRQDGTCTVISLHEAHEYLRVHLTGSDCDGIRDLAFNGKWIFAACRDTFVRKYDFNQVNVHFK